MGMLAKAAVGETEDSMIWSQQPVTLQRKTPLNPMTAYAYPVYATRFSQHWMLSVLEKKGIRKIKLKVDTGAAGNTLPLRTYKQMFKTLPLRTYKQMYKTLPLRTYKQMYKTLPLRTYKQMYKTRQSKHSSVNCWEKPKATS